MPRLPSRSPAAAVPLLDTPQGYGLISRFLHWSMAALILWQLLGMVLKVTLGRSSSLAGFFVRHHAETGCVIFVLILARVAWLLAMRRRRPGHGSGLRGAAVKAGHGALYLLMLMVPSLALLRAFGSTRGFAPFGIELAAPKPADIAWMVEPGHLAHGVLGWTMGVLLLGHVLMVGLHEGLWRDGTLRRMAGRA